MDYPQVSLLSPARRRKINVAKTHLSTPWLFLSAYMTWEMGQDIINGLAAGSGEEKED